MCCGGALTNFPCKLRLKNFFHHPGGALGVQVHPLHPLATPMTFAGCNMTTFDRLDIGSSFSHIRYIFREYRSSSYMKVIGSRSKSQEQKKIENSYSRNVKLQSVITPLL